MDPAERLARAQAVLGHSFSDPELVERALTHPSFFEDSDVTGDYERLEFLGDAVLGLVVVEEVYRRFPDVPEGILTKLKIAVVAGTTLSRTAGELGLGELLRLGESERGTHGRGRASALENAFEALVGALYLDGGLDAARAFVLRTLGPSMVLETAEIAEHPKSALQEALQARGNVPEYSIESSSGPPHDRTFTAVVRVGEELLGRGVGRSKKEAEMNAAAEAVKRLERS